jgi:hypothetical protein
MGYTSILVARTQRKFHVYFSSLTHTIAFAFAYRHRENHTKMWGKPVPRQLGWRVI